MTPVNLSKNRNREAPSFANINLLGRCNCDCFFCLGKDIEKELAGTDHRSLHWEHWPRLPEFLGLCKQHRIRKLYLTGQNTDPLLCANLPDLIDWLQGQDFDVGMRTNGYHLAQRHRMANVNRCREEIGYSIHTLNPITSRMILGRKDIPDWDWIIPATTAPCRVSIVVNRCNEHEFFDLLRYIAKFENVRYIQVRRVSTDTRAEYLAPDIAAYERVYTMTRQVFPVNRKLWDDADEFIINGKPVVFWRTIRTSVNSFNYFTDGTISDLYFIVEGYLKQHQEEKP